MPAYKPEELHHLLEEAVSSGDMDAYLNLYEPEATLVRQNGLPATDHKAISEEIAPVLAVKGKLTVKTAKVVHSGEVALMHSRGAFEGIAPDGQGIDVPEHDATEVARRQHDGTWLMVVNNPWGAS